jgi:enoyl-CoA hydratase/carnithine racemase
MMYTCKTYSGAEATDMGLANACFADDAFDAQVENFVRGILANSWYSLRENKRLMNDTEGMSLQSGLAHEVFRSRGFGPDMNDRIAAFAARKK